MNEQPQGKRTEFQRVFIFAEMIVGRLGWSVDGRAPEG
jgi:hypothetical protein